MNIALLKQCGTIKRFLQDEYICMEGETGRNAYLLLQGTAEVTIKSFKDRYEGSRRTGDAQRFFRPKVFKNKKNAIAVMGPGSIIGEMSLLAEQPRSASVVVTSEEALALVLDSENFYKVLTVEPEIGFTMIQNILVRLDKALSQIPESNPVAKLIKEDFSFQGLKSLSKSMYDAQVKKNQEFLFNTLEYLSQCLARINVEISRNV